MPKAKRKDESKADRRLELEASLAEDSAYLKRLDPTSHQYRQVESKCRTWKRLLQELGTE